MKGQVNRLFVLHMTDEEQNRDGVQAGFHQSNALVGIQIEGDLVARITYLGGYRHGEELCIITVVSSPKMDELLRTQHYTCSALQQKSIRMKLPSAEGWEPVLVKVAQILNRDGELQDTVATMQMVGPGSQVDDDQIYRGDAADLGSSLTWVEPFSAGTVLRLLDVTGRPIYNRHYHPWYADATDEPPTLKCKPKKEKKPKKDGPGDGGQSSGHGKQHVNGEERPAQPAARQSTQAQPQQATDLVSLEAVNNALSDAGFQIGIVSGKPVLYRKWRVSDSAGKRHQGAPRMYRHKAAETQKPSVNSMAEAFSKAGT